jgi:hypothetical protein
LVALHPAYLNEVKRLPGYNGKDVQITYECTASSGQGLAYREGQTQRYVYTFRIFIIYRPTLVPEVYFYYFHCEGERKTKPWLKAAIDSLSRANQFELGSDPDSVS